MQSLGKFTRTGGRAIRVIKLGGSLMDLPNLPGLLWSALDAWPPMDNLIVVGGGKAADLIRVWDERWQLGKQRSHRLAIFAMTWNARQLFRDEPGFHLVRDLISFQRSKETSVLLAEPFLNSIVPTKSAPGLPESWDLTSDSIAAYVAHVIQADQLVLLKSTDWDRNDLSLSSDKNQIEDQSQERFSLQDISAERTLQCLADNQLVDSYFPRYASLVHQVFWCNLRNSVVHVRQANRVRLSFNL